MALEPGDVVAERYRIDRKLGQGGMGSVYRATQLGLARAVAIKILRAHVESAEDRKRFEREARILAALRHPGAVQIFDFGEHEGRPYIVMELLIGESLRDRLARGALDFREAARVVRQIADVLVTTHEINLVHRDIKPDNVFLEEMDDAPDRVILVDFGLAFIAEEGELGRMTRDGLVSGTPQYVSPEQARDENVGPASDVYSLGVMLFYLVGRRLPFRGSIGELVSSHLYGTPPRLSTVRSDAPVALEALVDKMLRKKGEERPTAAEVREALDRFLSGDVEDRSRDALPRGERAIDTTEAETLDSPKTDLFGPDLKPQHGRAARQLSAMPAQRAATRNLGGGMRFVVGVNGALDDAVRVALAQRAVGVEECPLADADPGALDGVLVLEAELDEVRAACARYALVLADAPADDLDRATELLRLGVADVVARPLAPERVARKVERALKRGRR